MRISGEDGRGLNMGRQEHPITKKPALWKSVTAKNVTGTGVIPYNPRMAEDQGNHLIQKFNSSGQFLAKWGSNGSGIGEFHFPYWIGVEGSEYIYVVDSGNHRIQKCHSGG